MVYIVSNGRLIVKDVERIGVGNLKVLHQCLPERTMKILENLSG